MGKSRKRPTKKEPPAMRAPAQPPVQVSAKSPMGQDGAGLTQLTARLAAQQGLPVTAGRPRPPGPRVGRAATSTEPAISTESANSAESASSRDAPVSVTASAVAASDQDGSAPAGGGGLVVSVVAVLIGYLSAKVYYMVQHRQSPRKFVGAGTCIQGFLLGAFGTGAVALAITATPVGLFLDLTTPGLFFAMALGRPGCFLGGCCVGRPTASRWGLWSSDRRLGVRRIPVQLLEASMTLGLGLVTLTLVLTSALPLPGALFVGGIAAYTAGRQLLFPLRREPRRTPAMRQLTLAVSGLVAVAAVLLSVIGA